MLRQLNASRAWIRNRSRRGSEVVEFALVFPVFLLLVMGAIEYSWLMATIGAMHASVRTGARAGAVSATEDVLVNALDGAEDAWLAFGNGSTATFSISTSGTAPNIKVVVIGTLTYNTLTGLVPPMLVPRTVTREASMHLEDQVL